MTDLLELPATREDVTAFNLKRWSEVLADSELSKLSGKVETDQFGRILMSPPAAYEHGSYQFRIARILDDLMEAGGRVSTETPISTKRGVRAADVTWASVGFVAGLPEGCVCLPSAPEICVEVVSPSNTKQELEEKRNLYFEAGAKEFWLCVAGKMSFHFSDGREAAQRSELCPDFPGRVVL